MTRSESVLTGISKGTSVMPHGHLAQHSLGWWRRSVVPMRRRTTLALDTCALGNALDDETTMRRFVQTIGRKYSVVFVSDIVLFELSSDRDVSRAFERLRALRRLCRELHGLIFRSPDHKEIMRVEVHERLKGPLAHRIDWSGIEDASDADLREIASQLPESYEWMRQKKKDLFESDRSLYRYLAEEKGIKLAPDALVKAIAASDPPRTDEMIVEMAAGLSNGNCSAEQIVADSDRFRVTHVASHLVWRLCLANCADPSETTAEQEQVLGVWRTKGKGKGDGAWYDAFIAGTAAYMDILVSDDKNLRRRCEFLRKRGLLSFRTQELSEFLA